MGDIAKIEHWDDLWKHTRRVPAVSRINYYDFRLRGLFDPLAPAGSRVLELGCGGSRWVPYFNFALHCETWGIDYSPEGLNLIRRSLPPANTCRLVQGDFFDEDALPRAYFDFVYSLGFVEHFSDTTVVTRRISDLLRPGGKVMTLIPNFVGLYGSLQELVDSDVFRKHIVMDGATLDEKHQVAGLAPVHPAQFWGCFGPGVVNYTSLGPRAWGLGRLVLPALKVLQHCVCWSLWAVHLHFESRHMSPYIVGVYQKA